MAGFETIVRPAVFPNIRPSPARTLPGEDDPTKGQAVIGGSGGGIMGMSYSYSLSVSRNRPTEQQRRVDEATVYQVEDDGTVNKSNFIDINVANKIWIEGLNDEVFFYQPVEEKKNIEVKRKNVIKKRGDK